MVHNDDFAWMYLGPKEKAKQVVIKHSGPYSERAIDTSNYWFKDGRGVIWESLNAKQLKR